MAPLILPMLLALSGGACAETLTLGGTGSALATMRLLGDGFARKEHGFQLSILPSLGSGGAIKGLASNSLDLGVSSRLLKDSEKALSLRVIPYAQSPLVLVTNKQGEQTVATVQLENIYAGRQAQWGDRSPIRLVLRPIEETDNCILMTLSPGMKAAVESARSREGLVTAVTDQDAADALERLPGSLGMSTLGLILAEKRPLQVLSLNGVPPLVKGAVNPDYPLLKPLYLVTREDAKPLTRRFIEYVQSAEGRAILHRIGYSHGFR
ncbi:MAG: substrate-binding domain-containing protein [Rhodocyclaceae bacterium]|nr:substrate-binding domain-containing protein [Rhodocyclaceae bacterium]